MQGVTATSPSRRALLRLRAAASADGADDSGLAALLWAHALQASGDALIAVALAGTVFFNVPLGEARGRVALYLGLTLLPFALLVPVAGPLLDRFRHGRRNVLAATNGSRGLLAWSLAGTLASLSLYPLALALLILGRAYGVARAVAVVRVRPPTLGLVAANARMNVAATASAGLAAAVGVGISATIGSAWVLRLAALLLIAGAVAALRLPAHVDEARTPRAARGRAFRLSDAPTVVRRALVAVVALRILAGVLTVDLAFLLRAQGTSGPVIALVLGSALAGGLLGTGLASKLRAERTARLTGAALLAPAASCLLAAVTGAVALQSWAVAVTGLAASLAKYALDASLQTHVGPAALSSAFARSETALQLGWAAGGALGLALSLTDQTGLGDSGAVALCFAVATLIPAAGLVVRTRWGADPQTGTI